MSVVLHYYSATWCGPCKMFGPIMDEVSAEVPVVKFDIDSLTPEQLAESKVRSVPTIVLLENNVEQKRFSGVKSYDAVIDWINHGN